MRVVAGSARGRRLQAPAGSGTRPTGDRVREAVFNALASRDAIEGADVLDAFAGSGAMGIEALSRGARRATFVEADRRAAEVVRANVRACGFDDRSEVVVQPIERYLASRGRGRRWDLAVLDPPYAYDAWDDLLDQLDAEVLVVESDRGIPLPERWDVVRDRTYGTTVVRIAERRPTTSELQE